MKNLHSRTNCSTIEQIEPLRMREDAPDDLRIAVARQ
jgi:hypothetical protein